jgi:hypothetical protein
MDPIIVAALVLGIAKLLDTLLWSLHESRMEAHARRAEAMEKAKDRAAKLMVLGHYRPATANGKETVVPITESHSVSN